jgi:hypothetical protein
MMVLLTIAPPIMVCPAATEPTIAVMDKVVPVIEPVATKPASLALNDWLPIVNALFIV